MTKEQKIVEVLLKESSLTGVDAARLILEGIEMLGELVGDLGRQDRINKLRQVIVEGVKVVQNLEKTVSLEVAAWASVQARSNLRPTTRRDLRYYVRKLLQVEGATELPLRNITVEQCRYILNTAFSTSLSSYKKARAILHSIFTYGIQQGWCDVNPVARIEIPKIHEKIIIPLTPSEVKRLQDTVKKPEFRDMQFSLNLMLYGGIRPTEVSRLKLEDFYWDEGLVFVRPLACKTGGGRTVPLRGIDNIKKSDRIIPKDWLRRWKLLRRAAGFREWTPDICRHTFASYHVAMFRNMCELQLEMGHRDLSLLRSRYVVPVNKKEAYDFWKGVLTEK